MKLTRSQIAVQLAVIVGLLGCLYLLSVQPKTALGSAPTGLPATVATTSNPTVTTTTALVFATTTGGGCAARIISTQNASTTATFSDLQGSVPTDSFGIQQAANTTVVYDSGQYGCGAVRIHSAATQLLTVIETR